MAISKEDILEAIGSMSVLDLSELIKEMEDKFGVSAAAAVAAPLAGAAAAGGEAVEEKTEFDLHLTGIGDNKVNVIKAVRELQGLALKKQKILLMHHQKLSKKRLIKLLQMKL